MKIFLEVRIDEYIHIHIPSLSFVSATVMTINTFRYHLLWSFHPRSHRRSHEEKMIEASQRIIGQQNSNHSLAIDNRMCSFLSIAVHLIGARELSGKKLMN
jgi:hypothetical protein